MLLPISLCTFAACALITIWLMARCGRVRATQKILHGDGGNDMLMRRMRAQINFIESAPFILLLILGIELAGKGGMWLAIVAAIYVIGRVLHAFGMDSGKTNMMRGAGVLVTMLTLLGLAVYAALIAVQVV